MVAPSKDRPFFEELGETLGKGGMTGAAIAGGTSLLALISGAGKQTMGWMRWLLLPVGAAIGGIAGDFIKKDGPVFGDKGLVKALKSKSDPKTIPEGYIAANPYAETFAMDSATLAHTGEVHTHASYSAWSPEVILGYRDSRALDPFVEFSIKDDPRMEPLKAKAREYGKRFVDSASPEYIADVREREKKIVELVVQDIGETYGAYSMETVKTNYNEGERKARSTFQRMLLGARTAELCEMEENSLVCRHYAPIASVLLQEAGVPNHILVSKILKANKEGEEYIIDTSWEFNGSSHITVITDQGNSIVEATRTMTGRPPYMPILNGTNLEQIIFTGTSGVTESKPGEDEKLVVYGGHNGDGTKGSKEAAEKALKSYAEQRKKEKEEALKMQQSVTEFMSQTQPYLDNISNMFKTMTTPKDDKVDLPPATGTPLKPAAETDPAAPPQR